MGGERTKGKKLGENWPREKAGKGRGSDDVLFRRLELGPKEEEQTKL